MSKTKREGVKRLGSFKALGIAPDVNPTKDTICRICFDTASKRWIGNPCACQTHREYLR